MTVRRTRPSADKLLRKMLKYQRAKVIDFKAFQAGKQHAETLRKTVASDSVLAELHPAHAIYMYAQNQLSVMAEQLTSLKELDRLTRPLAEAEDNYMPSGPPMSPLTQSFFTRSVNFQPGVIFLEGLPDVAESRPCSRVNMQGRG